MHVFDVRKGGEATDLRRDIRAGSKYFSLTLALTQKQKPELKLSLRNYITLLYHITLHYITLHHT